MRRGSLLPVLAVTVIGIAVTACGSTASSASSAASDAVVASAHATATPPAAAFGVGGNALGAPKVVVQMQFDIVQDHGSYVPAATSVAVGDIIEWDQVTSQEQEPHNVTFDAERRTSPRRRPRCGMGRCGR